jgi:hypothetical protein
MVPPVMAPIARNAMTATIDDIRQAIDRHCTPRFHFLVFEHENPWYRAAYAALALRRAAAAPPVEIVPDDEIRAAAAILGIVVPENLMRNRGRESCGCGVGSCAPRGQS